MSTHPTAEEIAREAADKIRAGIHATMLNGVSPLNLDFIILTAARRIVAQERERLLQMVRESGAEHALGRMIGNCTRYLEERPVPMSEMYQENPPPSVLEEARAALAKLRAITQP